MQIAIGMGITQQGGGGAKTLASIAAQYGGTAILLDAGKLFQDRSATPSTVATIGDPVGTIVGADGTYYAIADTDAHRSTLRADTWGNLYLEGVSSSNLYIVQDSGGSPLAFANAVHTSVMATENGHGRAYSWGSASYETGFGAATGETFAILTRNEANGGYLVLSHPGLGTARHIGSLWYDVDPIFKYNGGSNGLGSGTPYQGQATGLALMSRSNASASKGSSKFFGGLFVPGALLDADEAVVRAQLVERMAPPTTPTDDNPVELDFANDTFAWGGQSRVLADLIDNLDGSYTLDHTDWHGREVLLQVDFNIPDETAHTADTMFARLSDSILAFAIEAPNDTGPVQFHVEEMGTGAAAYVPVTPGNLALTEGLMRVTMHAKPGEPVSFYYNGNANGYNWSSVPCPYFEPPKITTVPDFGTGTVLRLAARGGVFTDAEVKAFCNSGVAEPIHFVADSFGSEDVLSVYLSQQTAALGFIAMSTTTTGGVGWDVLAPQYTGGDSPFDATLVMVNGSDEITYTVNDGLAHIASCVSALDGHSRWLYIESNPISATGVGGRDTWETYQASYRAYAGGHYVNTLEAMQCAHDDSAQDIADVGNDIWPDSLRGDSTHLNDAGKVVHSRVIRSGLLREGYITGITRAVPSVPTSFAETTLDLSWDMPTDDGNDPVRSWMVYVEDSPGSETFSSVYTGQLRRHTLTGLTTGTWAVRVTATNEVGEGAHAEISVTV